ncbi:MAG TPA: GGDEF domain-containing protein [Thauera sp.]|uniref:GGDEF domain-containing protein n=1 Tax=Thauera sp. TaxID=1905334 RepID=UPI002D0A2B2C|nr:GGDEF domain-containing protein [Thauera sp.]HRP26133.1 GGDEF domain-containing protein [Thauera sp.]HRP65885.1 GGDEF domain-containing protein [Thauera sp.]
MKFGIAAKLAVVLALVGMLAAGISGFYAYSASKGLLVQSAKAELLTSTRVLARRITVVRQEISRTLRALARHPAALAVLDNSSPARAAELATQFALLQEANPAYFQIRLIAADGPGLERVRVDRNGSAVLHISGDHLQKTGHHPYVVETLRLRAGEVYMSRVALNHERGADAALHQPSVQFATPVVDASGRTRGVIVINADLNGVFGLLAADLPPDFQLFLTNGSGDYLVHPDASRTFGFDRGRRIRVQDEFPATQKLVDGRVEDLVIEARSPTDEKVAVVAGFIAAYAQVHTEDNRFVLGLAQPLDSILARAAPLGGVVLQIVLGLSVAGILIASILARAITRPINALSNAVECFSDDGRGPALPVRRKDEIGALARRFAELRTQVAQQMGELEHLAQHDPLTDLPNRALFDDRMRVALAAARRDDSRLVLLFIDLDDFKPINDRLGHAAGDRVLKGVAARIRQNIRESDTAARIGGDEFVILLRSIQSADDAARVVQKIDEAIGQPFELDGHRLRVSASIGVAVFPEDGLDAAALSRHADAAMYRAKHGARAADRSA